MRAGALRLFIALGALVIVGVVAPVAPAVAAGTPTVPDPAAVGPLTPVRVEYDAGPTVVNDPKGLPLYPAEITGVVWFPKQLTGALPVVLLLHGNHGTCDVLGAGGSAYPCPVTPVTAPHRNHAGYDYLASNLASHGYVVASVDANAVNTYNVAGDKGANERAQLLARTLDAFGKWNVTAGPGDLAPLVGHIDLSRIGMMGHSRGGEGVTNFLDYNRTRTDGPRYKVAAVFSLAGTDYNLPSAEGAAFGNLLPLCDGDVYDLQSSFPWDRGHVTHLDSEFPRVQFTVPGTNHNYFNTEWQSDDYNGADVACNPSSESSRRLSPEQQRAVGLSVLAAFMRRYVGNELVFDSYMTGAMPFPSLLPMGHSYVAPAAQRRYVISPVMTGDTLRLTAEGAPLTATDFATYTMCDPHADTGADGNNRDPGLRSGCPTNPNRTRVRQLTLGWTQPALLRAQLAQRDVRGFGVLSLRTAVNFKDARNLAGSPQDFVITLVDGAGHRASVRASALSTALVPPPGDLDRELTLNGVRVPLTAFTGVNLADVGSVELRFGAGSGPATGSIQLSQLAFAEPPVVVAANVAGATESLPATGGQPLAAAGVATLVGALVLRRTRPAALR
ncbi:MAG: hypothetical protein Q8K63_04185 [Acidimicrobiales bacterium]|nr:hypothetical protein [Acidimicrobiales bacterium]